MNEIQQFTFYRNYYDLIRELKPADKIKFLEAIVYYVFEDKEPVFKGLNSSIWQIIKVPLDTSKHRANNHKKDNSNDNQKEIKNKSNDNQNKISDTISISSSISISNKNKNINKDEEEIIARLNELAGTNFRAEGKATKKLIDELLKDYTKEEVLYVVEKMCYIWGQTKQSDKDMSVYLRPSTLFRKSNFENYLGMKVPEKKITTEDLGQYYDFSEFR